MSAESSRGAAGGKLQRDGSAKHAFDACFYALLAGLALTPFWFGSDRPIAWDINAIYFGVLTIVYEIACLATGRKHPVSVQRLWFPALASVVVGAWALLQVSPYLPVANQEPIWSMAREMLGRDIPGAISTFPDETMLTLVKFVTGVLVFWLSLQLTRNPQRARMLVAAVGLSGAVYAVYGLLAYFAFPKTILWYPKFAYIESVTSTFVNRNSYATYAGIGLVCVVALAFSQFVNSLHSSQSKLRVFANIVANVAGQGGGWIAAALVLSIAWIMTGSRGGVVATVFAVLVLASFAAIRGRKNAATAGAILILAFGSIGIGAFSYGDYLADRIATQGFASEDRLATYQLALTSIFDAPWTGFGWGTFRQVFPMYRDSTLDPFPIWDLAHNTYLELFQGLGIPMAGLFLLAILYLLGRCVHASLTRKTSATAPLVAVAVTVLVGLHAFVDFSLQMQAIALTWTALLAAGVAQSWSSRSATQD
ncbi:O-antigen ligase [Rhodoblastus sphagnicola]|uniref:O-antigen ligase family protein n=1 Tax=Rhodoblastus sphagnicola TaxID=333368 RepID=UPI00161390DF|nr:O-antigen ligase family protein [Rhodoblastus sphagnicola]MBB4200566.1 O-antigen ligase [Rhodoblastus sphagnicola]